MSDSYIISTPSRQQCQSESNQESELTPFLNQFINNDNHQDLNSPLRQNNTSDVRMEMMLPPSTNTSTIRRSNSSNNTFPSLLNYALSSPSANPSRFNSSPSHHPNLASSSSSSISLLPSSSSSSSIPFSSSSSPSSSSNLNQIPFFKNQKRRYNQHSSSNPTLDLVQLAKLSQIPQQISNVEVQAERSDDSEIDIEGSDDIQEEVDGNVDVGLQDQNLQSLLDQSEPESEQNGKRKRRTLKKHEQEVLLSEFEQEPYPDVGVKERLALELGLPVHAIAIWFANRRMTRKVNANRYEASDPLPIPVPVPVPVQSSRSNTSTSRTSNRSKSLLPASSKRSDSSRSFSTPPIPVTDPTSTSAFSSNSTRVLRSKPRPSSSTISRNQSRSSSIPTTSRSRRGVGSFRSASVMTDSTVNTSVRNSFAYSNVNKRTKRPSMDQVVNNKGVGNSLGQVLNGREIISDGEEEGDEDVGHLDLSDSSLDGMDLSNKKIKFEEVQEEDHSFVSTSSFTDTSFNSISSTRNLQNTPDTSISSSASLFNSKCLKERSNRYNQTTTLSSEMVLNTDSRGRARLENHTKSSSLGMSLRTDSKGRASLENQNVHSAENFPPRSISDKINLLIRASNQRHNNQI